MAELGYKVVQRQQMYELNPGDVDGLTPEQIREKYPEEWARAERDPYAHRYPRAESYHDLSVRCVRQTCLPLAATVWLVLTADTLDTPLILSLEPVILELEREPADILFIGHGSVIRCIMAYLAVRLPRSAARRPSRALT